MNKNYTYFHNSLKIKVHLLKKFREGDRFFVKKSTFTCLVFVFPQKPIDFLNFDHLYLKSYFS